MTPFPQPGYGQVNPLVQPPTDKNGLGTASFVLGIIGIVLSFIPIVGWISSPVAFTGLGVGLGNLPRLRSGKASNKSMTWIGIGLSAGAIVMYVLYIVILVVAANSNTQG